MSGLPLEAGQAGPARLLSLDRLRGLLMVVMALDHAVYYLTRLHIRGEFWGGPYPSYDSGLVFLTRWVTHLAATGFFFLLGVGQGLQYRSRRRAGWGWAPITGQFLLRGVLLIALQLLVVNRTWELSPGGWAVGFGYFGVLYALGAALLLSAPLAALPPAALAPLAVAVALACAGFGPRPEQWEHWLPLWKRFALAPGGDTRLWVSFPAVSWLAPLLFGQAFAGWLAADRRRAFRRALLIGAALLATFAILRWTDGFFNIRPPVYENWIDFLNVVKYPPSLTFLSLTLGIDLVLLWLFSFFDLREPAGAGRRAGAGGRATVAAAALPRQAPRFPGVLPVFGRAALFFYVLHLFLYAGMGQLIGRGGVSIGRMYLLWLAGLAVLYPLCLWYGRLRQRSPARSILRLL